MATREKTQRYQSMKRAYKNNKKHPIAGRRSALPAACVNCRQPGPPARAEGLPHAASTHRWTAPPPESDHSDHEPPLLSLPRVSSRGSSAGSRCPRESVGEPSSGGPFPSFRSPGPQFRGQRVPLLPRRPEDETRVGGPRLSGLHCSSEDWRC
eukprot:114494_1